jgi:hypothetical protein
MTKYYYNFWIPFVANKKRILILAIADFSHRQLYRDVLKANTKTFRTPFVKRRLCQRPAFFFAPMQNRHPNAYYRQGE